MTSPTEESRWRRWRRSRPFYGGLLMILSALELFFSANLNPGEFQVHFGPTGFLSYVIPIVMLLCGVLAWVSPGQRLFYGILGTLTAVYSLIGLNLGGFFIGLLLGVVGGALVAAWSPSAVPEPAPADAPDDAFDERYVGQQSTAIYGTPVEAVPVEEEPESESPGLLTDSLPTSLRSPLHEPGGAGSADDERPPAPGSHQRLRYGGALFAVLVLVAVSMIVANGAAPASAAPCAPVATKTMTDKSPSPTPSSPRTAKKPAPPRTAGSAAPGSSPSLSASPSPSAPAKDSGGNIVTDIIGGILDVWHGIFGGGKKADATPSASPSPSPSLPATVPAPPAPGPTTTAGSPSPSKSTKPAAPVPCTPSESPTGPAKRAALDPGQPAASSNSSLVLTSTQEMHGLDYDGVVDLPTKTADGKPSSVRVLKFRMSSVANTPFEMRTPGGPKILETTSDKLTLSGNVEFYTTKLVGKLQLIPGLPPIPIELTFTPDSPPPLTLPDMTFKDVQVDLVYVKADKLTAEGFDLRFQA